MLINFLQNARAMSSLLLAFLLILLLTLPSLYAVPNNSARLVAWVVPWGERVDAREVPGYMVPGVVVAYDVDRGVEPPSLSQWLSYSVSQIEALRSSGREVFVNLFCEKYVPSWSWRGGLKTVRLDGRVLAELKRVLGDGEGAYIGFSELTSCVNDAGCREELSAAYRELREAFPAAKLYYYGSGGDDVNALLDLQAKAGLDYVGIDFWDLELGPQGVRVKRYLVSKVEELARRLGWGKVIVGEVGLRVDDEEAYIEPWNWGRRRVFNESADARYYSEILTGLLVEEKVAPAFIGVWAWNDGVFAVRGENDVLDVLSRFATSSPEGSASTVRLNTPLPWVFPWVAVALAPIAVFVAVILQRRHRSKRGAPGNA
ncbi:hypothetical protein Tpen_1671 [Thermofilum pendens Hrk 5]|uniref:Uncharacterized protein n=2 Tax=Thermofilum pendens TaxID=2269 RepID=A1S0T6_THEPD|nr:hypothetical protein Tpen_1671 [Thermofilum pendens Hrk 5]